MLAVKKNKKEDLLAQIRNIGVLPGDIVFLAADLLRVGYFNQNREQTLKDWVDILTNAVGPKGTLIVPAYTTSFQRFRKDKKIVFDEGVPTTSGALSVAFQSYPGVLRSKHPTNSCFAIGPHANHILQGHDESASSYLPYLKVIEMGGKNLMIGAFSDTRLAPMAMHAAQETVGITERHWAAGLIQSYYKKHDGSIALFTRRDVGGCTAGGYKTIGHHIVNDAINFGVIGNALSAYIDCGKSHRIFVELFNNNPLLIKCDDNKCLTCYGSPIHKHPFFWLKLFLRRALKRK